MQKVILFVAIAAVCGAATFGSYRYSESQSLDADGIVVGPVRKQAGLLDRVTVTIDDAAQRLHRSTPQRKSVVESAIRQVMGSSLIIIDVKGDGVNLTDRIGGVNFDINNTGRAVSVSWTAPESDDVFLALDRNGNGIIDNGAELFGGVTPQPATSGEPNGFKALAVFDKRSEGGNENGRIDPGDAIWQRLVLWRDYNHNGKNPADNSDDELVTVRSTGICYIDLDYKLSKKVDAHGNRLRYRAKVQAKKIAPWAYDVYLQTN